MKLALIIGINYTGKPCELRGCVQDANNLQKLLVDHFEFSEDGIVTLVDGPPESNPTRANIIRSLCDLVARAQAVFDDPEAAPLEHIWVSYAGHGTHIPDMDGDEPDGNDEVIVSWDLKLIRDDIIMHYLALLQEFAPVTCVFDSCNSGTVGDLPYMYVENLRRFYLNDKCRFSLGGANPVRLLSGCMDHQQSTELMVNGSVQGAMSALLVEILADNDYAVKWHDLIVELFRRLRLKHIYSQNPRLSASGGDIALVGELFLGAQ